MARDNLLMFADSERDADMLYAVGMFVPDPFIFLRTDDRNNIFLNDLEVDRASRVAPHCRVFRLSTYIRKLQKAGVQSPSPAQMIHRILVELGLKKATVPFNFPIGLANELRDLKIKLRVCKGPCFADREIKNAEQVKKISATLIMAEVGLAEGIQALKRAKIGKGGRLIHQHIPLTSEKLRSIIDTAIVQAGGRACNTIVASGKQASDPHERGHGPLRANQPIILDVFPRSQKTGYFGDITRTVVRGQASDNVRKIYSDVVRAQELVFAQLRHGRSGLAIHKSVEQFFKKEGYKTGNREGRKVGFIHGTGHGLGLEIHEAPRISATSTDFLRSGHVVTVEPGLYYPRIGGIRIEDVALVTAKSPRNLTKFEKVLEL